MPIYLGCEYEAVFLSTAEPTEADGRSKNHSRSPCAQQVFNTVITRAKSLVVCAGNPLLLMTTEKFMDNEAFCWKEYIKRCLLNKTFYFPPELIPVTKEYTDGLLREIFTPSSKAAQSLRINGDKILESLNNEFRKFYGNRRLYFNYAEGKYEIGNKVSRKMLSRDTTAYHHELKGCTIQIKSRNLAIAYTKSDSITIKGFNNRRGAFDGDTVDVAVLEGNCGRVVRVVESNHCETFVCRADPSNVVVFTPVNDEIVPKFNNIPWISKGMLLNSPDCHDLFQLQGKHISIFNEKTLLNKSMPRIKQLIPHSDAPNLLFVIKFIKWGVKFQNALGAVIEALPVTTNPFFTEQIFQIIHNLPPENTFESFHKNGSIESYHKSHSIMDESLVCYNSAFTIDPPSAEILDDAISLEPCKNSKEGVFELAVLITSVSEDITDDMITYAEQRGVSIYTKTKCKPMLPFDYCEQFSLKQGQLRKVIAIKANVVIRDGNISLSNVLHERAQVISQLQLDYEKAQQILNGNVNNAAAQLYDKKNVMCLKEQLSHLLKIAQHLRVERLGSRGYYYDCNDDESKWWQSHLIVKELMIWANRYIAQHVLGHCPNIAILRIQHPPTNDEMLSLQAKYGHIFSMEEIWPIRELANELIVPLATLENLKALGKSAIEDHSAKVEFLYTLFNCQLYPQLAAVDKQQRKIFRTAQYVCSDPQFSDNEYLHYSLGCDPYTHFTSPLRRYCDLVMQTILLNGAGSYTPKEIREIYKNLNLKTRSGAHYERNMEGVTLVRNIEVDMKQSQAFVINTGNEFELYFPPTQYKCIKSKHTSFTLSNLQCTNGKWLVVSGSLQRKNIFKEVAEFKRVFQIDVTRSLIKVNWEQKSDCESITATTFTSSVTNGHKKQMQYFEANVVSHVIKLSWRSAHECVVSPTETNIRDFLNDLAAVNEHAPCCRIDECDKTFCDSSVIVYKVHKLIKEFNSVKVWLGRSVSDVMPTPRVCLIEVTPTITICVQHNISPAQCFSDVWLTSALRKTYYSMNQYVDMWNKVLLAEAVNDITSEKAIFMIRNVTLDWGELDAIDDGIDDMHYTPKDLVTFKIPEESDITYFIEIEVGCCICARFCQKDLPNAVYHFVVNKVGTGNDDSSSNSSEGIEVRLKAVGNASCHLSPKFKSSIKDPGQVCDLQIIQTPVSFRYVSG